LSYILALNCGSSTLKYQVFDSDTKQSIISGNVEKVGKPDAFVQQEYPDGKKVKKETALKDHAAALDLVISMLTAASIDLKDIVAVGHRVAHGGEKFKHSIEITDEVIKTIDELSELAPLHNPANLAGILGAKKILPHARQVAVFDTAFHQTMPDYSYRYAVPGEWYRDLHVRKYGFHGTSHLYVSKRAAVMLGKPAAECNLISMHMGSGASACAIKHGNCLTTSMGMTPLTGLVMGTRCGDLSPSVFMYVKEKMNLSDAEMMDILNKKSGILGITEKYSDRRDVEKHIHDDDKCRLAYDIEAWRAKKYIGQYFAAIGEPIDAIIFTAGGGERDWILREKICEGLGALGANLDKKLNKTALAQLGAGETDLSAADSRVKIFMIPTDEEAVLVEDTIAIMNGTYNPNHLEMDYSFAH